MARLLCTSLRWNLSLLPLAIRSGQPCDGSLPGGPVSHAMTAGGAAMRWRPGTNSHHALGGTGKRYRNPPAPYLNGRGMRSHAAAPDATRSPECDSGEDFPVPAMRSMPWPTAEVHHALPVRFRVGSADAIREANPGAVPCAPYRSRNLTEIPWAAAGSQSRKGDEFAQIPLR